MLKVQIVDGQGSGKAAKINGDGEFSVTVNAHPPGSERSVAFPFRQYLTSTGISSGSNDMIVDGSSTAQSFYVSAKQDRDIYIKTLSIRIGDTGTVTLNRFGALTELTNGCRLIYRNDALGEVVIADELKTNLSLLRLGMASGAVGTGDDAYLLDVQGGGAEDTYLPVLDLAQTFGMPWGLRIKKGSNDRFLFSVHDNLTGLITFNAIAFGIQF